MTTLLTHYAELLAYDSWANERCLAAIETVPTDRRTGAAWERLTALVPHNLVVKRIWRWRILEQAHEKPASWFPPMSVEAARAMAREVDAEWAAFFPTLTAADMERSHSFKTSDGTPMTRLVRRTLTHLFNHGTYHRGQIARLVTEHGGERPATDFMLMTF
ncbi:MAG: DinB family protein [Planctomycetota bacterium]|nr:DinB family protein [Planctomycetota bacterium]